MAESSRSGAGAAAAASVSGPPGQSVSSQGYKMAMASYQRDAIEFPHCDEVSKYEKSAKIGQGTFG